MSLEDLTEISSFQMSIEGNRNALTFLCALPRDCSGRMSQGPRGPIKLLVY